ncbi:putative stage IV sporulation YqfD [Alkaliphilus oremlandii OhILAs]|uniref:Putative stage IV sporulation YqfD n=1 Tax=Alkaliphilus oremlandii (strain OhILAs) TaxID=350688 RepID=A8MG63_ALKOO|nr:putative stage IV sporulation YqfD [Alkaliphilus oremlandii OhILAs]
MLILKLWNYMRGYVNIRIEGLALERFINLCIAKGIYLWDIQRINHTALEGKVSIKGFKELRGIVKKAGCRVSIKRKNGYPFWIHKLKKRKMLLVGAFFCFTLLIFSSTFIFSIEVSGNHQLERGKIIGILNDLGLKPGANRYKINIKDIETQMLLDMEELAWVGIEIKGIKARVEIAEKRLAPDIIDKNTPCNVVASKKGVIEKVIARNGDPKVSEGDIVKEGDILISGIIERDFMETDKYVHSYGEVFAKTYYEGMESKNLIEIKKEKTGKTFKRRMFKFGNLELSINNAEIPYNTYILEKESKKPFQWRNIGLPVEIIIEEYYEAVEIEEKISEPEAEKAIHSKVINQLLKEIPLEAEILDTKINFTTQDDILYGKVIIEVLENIAQQKRLQIGVD